MKIKNIQPIAVLVLGTALLAAVAGCGGNGTVNPTGNVSNFQAINQGNPNLARLITVVPAAAQVTSLVTNGTNPNTIVTTAGSTLTTIGALSMCGNNEFNLQTTAPNSEVFAVNSGSVTPIQVNADGTLVLGTPTNPNNIVPFTGGNASCSDGFTCFVAAQVLGRTGTPTAPSGPKDPPQVGDNVIDSFNENGNNAPTQSGISPPLPAPIISLSSNEALQVAQDGLVFGANGTNTQLFENVTPEGTAVSVDGAGTDSVVTDTRFVSQGGNTPPVVVVAAGPQTVDQTAGGTQFGINVGSAFVVFNNNTFALASAGSSFIPLAGATATTVPTSATFVFGNTVNGSGSGNPAFVVIGTNTPTVPLVIIPVNQQVNQQNGFLNLATNNQLIVQLDGQGVTGLNTPQNLALGNGSGGLGFDTENIFVGVTGSGAGTGQNAFGASVNPLSNPALVFTDLIGSLNIPLGTEAASLNANPVSFTSNIFP